MQKILLETSHSGKSGEIVSLVLPPLFIAELMTEQRRLEALWKAQDARLAALGELIDHVARVRRRALHVVE